MNRAYVLGNSGTPPTISGKDWYIVRMALGIIGKDEFAEPLSKEKLDSVQVVPFIVATKDKESLKELLSEQIDNLFNAWDSER